MASSTSNIILSQLKGQIGKQLVVKQYGKKTVITRYPDMSGIKPSALQKKKRKIFAEAVRYAHAIKNNSKQTAVYARKVKKGQSVYHFAIKEYMRKQGK